MRRFQISLLIAFVGLIVMLQPSSGETIADEQYTGPFDSGYRPFRAATIQVSQSFAADSRSVAAVDLYFQGLNGALTRPVTISIDLTALNAGDAGTLLGSATTTVPIGALGDVAPVRFVFDPAVSLPLRQATFIRIDVPGGVVLQAHCVAPDAYGRGTAWVARSGNPPTNEGCDIGFRVFPPETTPPVISHTGTPSSPDGDNGWYRSDVTVDWSVSEPDSPDSLEVTGCEHLSVTDDTPGVTTSCAAKSDGGAAGPVSVTVKRDATPPTIEAHASGTVGLNGWYTSNVAITYTCLDATSGISSGGCDDTTTTLARDGAAVRSPSVRVTDIAGNTSDPTPVMTFKIDRAAPTLAPSGRTDLAFGDDTTVAPNAPTPPRVWQARAASAPTPRRSACGL